MKARPNDGSGVGRCWVVFLLALGTCRLLDLPKRVVCGVLAIGLLKLKQWLLLLKLFLSLLSLLGEADVLKHENFLHMLALHWQLDPNTAHGWPLQPGRSHLLEITTCAHS